MLENKVIQEVRENNAHAGIDYMAFVDEMFRPEYKEKNVKIPDPVRRSLLRKSAGNRRFFDALVRLIWCECRVGCTAKSTSIDDWAEGSCKRAKKACFLSSAAEARQRHILLPHYGTSDGALIDTEIQACFNTPRNKLSARELAAVQTFIDTHTFANITDAQRQIAADLLNECCAAALNEITSSPD